MQQLLDANIILQVIINDPKTATPQSMVEFSNPSGDKLREFAEKLLYNNKHQMFYINLPVWKADATENGIGFNYKILASMFSAKYYLLKFADWFYTREYKQLGDYNYRQRYEIEGI